MANNSVNVTLDPSNLDDILEKLKQLKALVQEVKALTASIEIGLATDHGVT